MKLKYLMMLFILTGLAGVAHAADFGSNQTGAFGAGIGLGQPVGVTGKYWLTNIAAVDGMLGYHMDDNFDVHSDFLLHAYPFKQIQNGELPIYVGLGGRILAGDDTQFGLRFPFGVSYLYVPSHLEIFAEVAPVIRLNGIKGSVDGLVGLRMYHF